MGFDKLFPPIIFWKCNFPITPHVCRSVGLLKFPKGLVVTLPSYRSTCVIRSNVENSQKTPLRYQTCGYTSTSIFSLIVLMNHCRVILGFLSLGFEWLWFWLGNAQTNSPEVRIYKRKQESKKVKNTKKKRSRPRK